MLTGGKKIEEIDGTDSTIMSIGFPYLYHLTDLEKMVITRNPYLDDAALGMLKNLQSNLKHLELITCANITEAGIHSLVDVKSLKYLFLADLPSVKTVEYSFNFLKKGLSECIVEWQGAPSPLDQR